MHFGCGICFAPADARGGGGIAWRARVQRAVDGGYVIRVHSNDARVGVALWCERAGAVVFCGRGDDVERCSLGRLGGLLSSVRTNTSVHRRLHFGQGVGFRAVVVLGSNGGVHGSDVLRRDACKAGFGVVGRCQGWAWCLASCGGLDGVGDARQVVELGDGGHIDGLACAHDVVQKCKVVGVCSGRTNVCTNGGVLSGCRVHARRGVWGAVTRIGVGVVGFGQDGFVGVNDGLHFALRIDRLAIDERGVQSADKGR